MLSERATTFAVSFGIHAGVAFLLAWVAVEQVKSEPEREVVDLELVAAPPPRREVAIPPVPEPPEVPEAPAKPRRPEVPKEVEVKRVEEARPFSPDSTQQGSQEAPADTEVTAPTAPVFDMETTVGAGTQEYETTTGGGMAVPAVGKGRGGAGPLAGQETADVEVARDWEITEMPQPLNDGDFEPEYPPLARREGREAEVVLELYIDARGKVSRAIVVEGPKGHGFRESARRYARKLRFEPALAGQSPVASKIHWTVYFYARN